MLYGFNKYFCSYRFDNFEVFNCAANKKILLMYYQGFFFRCTSIKKKKNA